jgi:hypothetical protein
MIALQYILIKNGQMPLTGFGWKQLTETDGYKTKISQLINSQKKK